MTGLLTLYLACFFSQFQYVLQTEKRSIKTIANDYGAFLMFSIFEYVILFFPKHCNFRMFCCNSRRNQAYRQSKTSEDLWSPWKM